MKLELKDKWLKALRSKKYKQGKRTLRTTNNEYCCLGILCKVAELEIRKYPNDKKYFYSYGETVCDSATYLPASFASDINITFSQQNTLAEKNDNGENFDQIADWIEKNIGVEDE